MFTWHCKYRNHTAAEILPNRQLSLSILSSETINKILVVKIYVLFLLITGGYKMFSCSYPEYVQKEESDNCPVTAGLSSLNLIEPSTPKSSEVTTSPSFPIEVIRNLYLGNAKCSMDSDALSKHNIRYILNVTPNLPNHFEGSSDVHITYKQIPINDHWSQNLSVYFPEAIAFIGKQVCDTLSMLCVWLTLASECQFTFKSQLGTTTLLDYLRLDDKLNIRVSI